MHRFNRTCSFWPSNCHRRREPGATHFFSRDSIGFSASDANLYRYVGNTPTFYIDPFGFTEAVEKPILTSGNKITPHAARELNKFTGKTLQRRDWGRALESLKKESGLANNAHGKLWNNGNFFVNNELIGNILWFIA